MDIYNLNWLFVHISQSTTFVKCNEKHLFKLCGLVIVRSYQILKNNEDNQTSLLLAILVIYRLITVKY